MGRIDVELIGGMAMTRFSVLATMTALLLSHNAWAEEFGTFEEAQALLNRAITAVKADKQGAFEKFNNNDPRYRDRDLFVFCFDALQGLFGPHDAMVSHNVRDLRDYRDNPYGETMFAEADETRLPEVTYVAP